ncbi:hypothetical protein VT84_07530 [Gemmata sp. SH-PL17]|uniref:hypothetical protein n=1 Tax=Gemmata sp. SH-PL17 TaxID=1630693 RepID=UPI00078D46F7|nr:hypothetical protein [Gemmata sp. SH-PL17]AMV24231.1 hypothetical protein VT84_07530 [Gemmata sp. SH-PL17]
MSETSLLHERIQGRRVAPAEDDPDACEDCGAFGLLRGVKERALMLDLRFCNGNREALPYALLERVSFDPSDGLTLRFLGAVVTVRGRNLARPSGSSAAILDGIHRHRVSWIGEIDELHAALKPADSVVVTRIEIITK